MSGELPLTIRLARHADIEQLQSWPGFDSAEHKRALRFYLARQRRGGGALLVADCQGYPVGQLFMWFRRDDPELADGVSTVSITALRVRDAYRRRGIATRLARAAEVLAWKRGFRIITIGTDTTNETAHRLYLSWGYREFKRNTYEWDGESHPQICLRKELRESTANGRGDSRGCQQ